MEKQEKNENVRKSCTTSPVNHDSAPDGGWGWAVCFGSFLMNFVLDGTMFSFGVLLLKLLDYFGEGKAKTSWIGSSQIGMSMFMGPLVSILLERYSCRQITIAGTLLSFAAFVVSTFCSNVALLIITYGVIGGIGFSMSFISAIIVVGTYFSGKRAIATGIAMSGSGLGTFAYAYLTNFLLDKYDWRGTIFILSGILLNGVVCGSLFRPLSSAKHSRSEDSSYSSIDGGDLEEAKVLLNKWSNDDDKYFKETLMPYRLATSAVILHAEKDLMTEVRLARVCSSQNDCRSTTDPWTNQMSKNDVFYSGSLSRIHKNAISSEQRLSQKEIDCAKGKADVDGIQQTNIRNITTVFTAYVNLFKDKVFILLLLTNVCWTVQSVPLTYLPDLGVSKGLASSQAAMLISIVGITNIFGRVISGLVTDLFRIKSSKTYILALFTASVVNFLIPWFENFIGLAVCSALFGLCMATAVSMRTIVIADHLGMDNLTKAFGIIALFQGIAFMTNAPLAGYMYEVFNSYVMPFSFAGMMYFFSALTCLIMLCVDGERTVNQVEIIVNAEMPQDQKNVSKQVNSDSCN